MRFSPKASRHNKELAANASIATTVSGTVLATMDSVLLEDMVMTLCFR
jgi:hypothetical protein